MTKKDSIDKLLYQYAEKAFDEKFDKKIEYYTEKIEEENIQMDVSFKEFWQNKDKYKNISTIKRKRKNKFALIIVASLIVAVIIIGPNNVATYADYIYQKIISVFKEGTNIKYKDDFSEEKAFVVQKLKYIPNGFELVEESNLNETPTEYDAYYVNEKTEEQIHYIQRIISKDSINLDTENAITYERKIDNKNTTIVEKEDFNTILCEFDGYLYLLDGNIELDELEEVFTSILK